MGTIERIYEAFRQGGRVTTDSRDIQAGDIFIALKGENHDGNRFAEKAVADGAAYAVVDEAEHADGERRLLVEDGLRFLQQLARHHRRQLAIPVLGITGTNGKTTTKELCHAVLSKKYRTAATKGNLNNHIGVPLTLLGMTEETEFAIVEMGANHPGEIKTLCDIAEPDYGIITNIGRAHLEGLGSEENIVRTKRALYEAVNARQGTLFVNGRDSLLMTQASALLPPAKMVTYGTDGCSANGEIAQSIPFLVYTLKTKRGHLYVRTKLIGGYNFDNAMAATAVGTYFDIDPLDIQAAIEAYAPSNMRSQLVKTGRNTLILDAYNANPSSMRAAIDNFGEMKAERKIVIAGEMRELGPETESAHREVLEQITRLAIPTVYTVGKAFEAVAADFPNVTGFEDTDALIDFLKRHPVSGSFLLVKGSRGNKLERIVEFL